MPVLREVVDWREPLLYLGMPKHVADTIELDHKGVARQKMEAISWWLQNSPTASWKELADALWMTDNRVLARQLYEGIIIIVLKLYRDNYSYF